MSVSFLAPVMAGVVADRYGLGAAVLSIAVFPLLAAVLMVMLFNARVSTR
jgi:hypothetical protein